LQAAAAQPPIEPKTAPAPLFKPNQALVRALHRGEKKGYVELKGKNDPRKLCLEKEY
jgi:hypothetical protein